MESVDLSSTTPTRVVVVDDDPALLRTLERVLQRSGYSVHAFHSPDSLLRSWEEGLSADVILTDVNMPGKDGFSMLDAARKLDPEVPVILMTGAASVDTAVRALREGAYDYLVKPFAPIDVVDAALRRAVAWRRLRSENQRLALEVQTTRQAEAFIGANGSLKPLLSLVQSVAQLDVSVLILGESGTGKELVARALHDGSRRRHRRMVSVNCGALNESLLESELFGHVKGAFTGAEHARVGLFEEAHGSTLFLDEVGELSPATQVKLLRVLQEGEVRPVGSSTVRRVDVRIVAATHRDLQGLVASGEFREDLYFRLNVVGVHVPRLSERGDEIVDLAHYFLARHGRRLGKQIESIDANCLEVLLHHDWPGNIRELENAIIRAIAVCTGPILNASGLPPEIRRLVPATARADDAPLDEAPGEYTEARRRFERAYLERVLAVGRNLSESARIAGLDPSNLRRMLKKHGIKS